LLLKRPHLHLQLSVCSFQIADSLLQSAGSTHQLVKLL
jgi:hypothetical protein